MIETKAPIAVALDVAKFEDVERISREVSPYLRILKIGLQTFYRDGQKALDIVREVGCELFLDLKLHDIPNTIRGACKSLAKYSPEYLTVHASGGIEMMKAAVEELHGSKITAVTVLTSLSHSDIHAYSERTIDDIASALAESALNAGVGAIVCSGFEVEKIRSIVGDSIEIIVPGIRNPGVKSDDQQRTMTLSQAMQAGSDIVVIGRPITASDNAANSAREFADEYWSIHGK